MSKLSREEEQQLEAAVARTLREKPPTIGLVGVSGVGKSSTINAMFRTQLPISHTVACTKRFQEVPLYLKGQTGQLKDADVRLVVYDAPGLGEDVRRDPEYIEMYKERLPGCDVVLWITAARNRAIALDQQYLSHFRDLHPRMVFCISQVDLVDPMNWKGLIPSEQQQKNIEEIVKDRGGRLSDVVGVNIEPVPYSNRGGYNLEHLFTVVLEKCATGRKWIFGGLKAFSIGDFEQRFFEENQEYRDRSTERQKEFHNKTREYPRRYDRQHEREDSLFSSLLNFVLGGLGGQSSPPKDAEPFIGHVIGRDDFRKNPLTDDELSKIQQATKEKMAQRRPGNR